MLIDCLPTTVPGTNDMAMGEVERISAFLHVRMVGGGG
jgi:hypothetical protein